MSRTSWLDSRAALALLGVLPQTLYASVSRKRIRAKADPEDPRRSLYHAEDVRQLAARRRGRRRDQRVAEQAVAWGDAILASGICTVERGRLWYRGRDVVPLAERSSLEEVAMLLWQSPPAAVRVARTSVPVSLAGDHTALQSLYTVLGRMAGRDPPMYGRPPGPLQAEAVRLFGALCAAILQALPGSRGSSPRRPRATAVRGSRAAAARAAALPIHLQLAEAWGRPAAADLIRRALVLLADHELNASTFATRVAASTGAALSASVLAGFATLSGPLHGGAAAALQGLIHTARSTGPDKAILASLAGGRVVAGFGHRLYPLGDIRAAALLKQFEPSPIFLQLSAAADNLIGEPPNIDFALTAMADSARLPADAPFVLFALARSVGWIAHALEQSQAGALIRPRARYIGPDLEDSTHGS
ncbi:MAG: citrate synthase [Steroidobacteraceae bacterium]